MKKRFLLPVFLAMLVLVGKAQNNTAGNLPDSIFSGKQDRFHVQGIAIDQVNGFVYYSFTDKLVKTDLAGHLVGSVTGLVGHLGDLAFDAATGKIYGSLEFKNDAIGEGIRKKLGLKNSNKTAFYIAIFDGSRIVKPGMKADESILLQTVYLKEVVNDYEAEWKEKNKVIKHRFGCSGIDGVTLAPSIGDDKDSKKYLYVAYGIYGDTTRNDNNHQVLLQYDISNWNELGRSLSQDNPHRSGPEKPLEKYFVKTGNTRYGIQNLAYDDYTGNFFAAVYNGTKVQFPNYNLFVIDGHKKPVEAKIKSGNKTMKVQTLSLLPAGLKDVNSGIRGWYFKWGATGLFPLGNGLFYISHNKQTRDGRQETTLHKYQWKGNDKEAFVLAK
jgi:hypothetical protein